MCVVPDGRRVRLGDHGAVKSCCVLVIISHRFCPCVSSGRRDEKSPNEVKDHAIGDVQLGEKIQTSLTRFTFFLSHRVLLSPSLDPCAFVKLQVL